MKTDRSGLPELDAPPAASAPGPHATKRRRPAPAIAAGVFVLVICAAILYRHAVLGMLVTRGLGFATGDRISIGTYTLGPAQSIFGDVAVTTAGGDPLLTAKRVTVRYALLDLLMGKERRFGLVELRLEHPTLALVRRPDGSLNIETGSSTNRKAVVGGGATAAWNFDLKIRDGEARFIDRAPLSADLREQRIAGVNLDVSVHSSAHSSASGSAVVEARQTALAPLRNWPIRLHASADFPHGFILGRLTAERLPVRGLMGFFAHNTAVRIDDGLLSTLSVAVYALNAGLNRTADLRLGGSADLRAGRLSVAALALPVRDVRGRVVLVDNGLWSPRLDATLAGIPLVARGGVFDVGRPTLRLGLSATGDLTNLRRAFAFLGRQPLAGPARVQTVLEAPISNLLIRSAVHVEHGTYGKVPVNDVAGEVDYHAGALLLDGLRARYGSIAVGAAGRFLLGLAVPDATIVAAATGPGRTLPFAENLAPEARIDALAIFTGGALGYRTRGAVGIAGGGAGGRGVFAIDERGVGDFGPLEITRSDGSTLRGALRLERSRSLAAAWLSAHAFRIATPTLSSGLGGLQIPAFPSIGGIFDGELVGGGMPSGFALSGTLHGRELRAGSLRLGSGQAHLGGTLADLRLAGVRLTGELGTFRGSGAARSGMFALRGSYDGSLDRLVPLTGNVQAHGAVHGPLLATLAGPNVVVQSSGAAFEHATVRGVMLDAAAGTIAVRKTRFHLVAGVASIGGRHAVAAESQGRIALSAAEIPSQALRQTGLPLESGSVSAYGAADLRTKPAFDGTLAISTGRTHGYAVAGDAQVDLDGAHARIFGATGSFGSTYGSIGGSIGGIGERALRYDVEAHVPLGDIAALRHDVGLPVRNLAGSFTADLHVSGAGSRPAVSGRITAPEGNFNGLAFRAADAHIELEPDRVAARDAVISIGSTTVALSANYGAGGMAFAMRSPAVNLASFNDYFDASDTLAGRGRLDLALSLAGRALATSGRIDLRDVRYRRLPFGTVAASWDTRGATIAGQAIMQGPAGSLTARATISPALGPFEHAVRAAHIDSDVTVDRLDLGTWLPAAGLLAPILGMADARIHLAGQLPLLAVRTAVDISAASVAGVAVSSAHLRATSLGTRINIASSDADLGFSHLTGSGRLGLAASDPLAFDIRLATEDIGRAIHTFVPAARDRPVAGTLAADVRFAGTRGAPQIAGGFDLETASYAGFVVPRAIGSLALHGTALELRDADVEFLHGQAFVAGSLPLLLQPFRLGPSHAPLSFDVTARSVDLAQFQSLLPAGTRLAGALDGRFGVEGFVDRPRLFGGLAIVDGSYASALERAPLEHVRGSVAFAGPQVALQALHADLGGGSLDASGTMSLPLADRSRPQFQLTVTARAARLDFPAYGRGVVDGDVHLSGGSGQPRLTGDLALRNGVVPVSAVYGTDTAAATGGGGELPLNPALQLHVVAADDVRIRNPIVDIGVSGAVDVGGTLRAPTLAGGFTATDGTISSYSHIFRIVNAAVTFNPADGTIPTIDAQAVSRVSNPDPDPSRNIAGSANITVTVSGTADSNNLQVSYSSEPAYSQAQIVGLLLDVPALLGAVNFNLNGPGTPLLRGAPGETNALLPPGVTPEQVSAISFNQEVFSLLNGQFTQRALGPLERAAQKVLGLSDLEFTVDYGGGIGYSLRRQLGKRDFYAFLSQTVTYPERVNVGFELQPKPFESVNFSYYAQNGVTSLITNQTPGAGFLNSTRRLTSVQPLGNRSGVSVNFNRRF